MLEKLNQLKHSPANDLSIKYKTLSTVALIQPLLDRGYTVSKVSIRKAKKDHRVGHQFHVVRLRSPNVVEVGDSFPEIVISNSYDGTSSFTVYFGIFRLACSNGLVVGQQLVAPERVRHIGHDAPLRVLEAVAKVEQQATKIGAIIEKGQKIGIIEPMKFAEKILKQVYPQLEKLTSLPLNRPGDLDNSWTTFNLVQENLLKAGGLRAIFKEVNETGEIELKEK
jgi:hypothetical protein